MKNISKSKNVLSNELGNIKIGSADDIVNDPFVDRAFLHVVQI